MVAWIVLSTGRLANDVTRVKKNGSSGFRVGLRGSEEVEGVAGIAKKQPRFPNDAGVLGWNFPFLADERRLRSSGEYAMQSLELSRPFRHRTSELCLNGV